MMEAEAVKYLMPILNDTYDVRKLHEGCRADMAIRPKNTDADEWLGVQLKVRTCSPSQYSFTKIGKYPTEVVLCMAQPERKMWIFQGLTSPIKKLFLLEKKNQNMIHYR
jgi:hypothetical protein